MRLINKSIYALALASMMGLWSCSQDEALPGGQTTAKGHPVPVTLTVSRGEAQTRTFLSENEDGSLTDIWKEGDELQVYSGDGKTYHGSIGITSGEETSVGVFSGVLDNVTDGTADYFLWYVNGSNSKITCDKDSNGYYQYSVNYNEQGYKTIGELSAMDMLNQKITLKISGTTATVTQNYTMEAKLPLVHFTLGGALIGATGDLRIYDDNRSTKCPYLIGTMRVNSLNGKEPRPSGSDNASQYLTAKVTNGEVFLAMHPFVGGNATDVKLRFEFDKDGKTYTYQFNNSTALNAGTYYSAVLDMQLKGGDVATKPNPADMGNWGGLNINPVATDIGVTKVADADGWTNNDRFIYENDGFGTYIRFEHNGMINGYLTSKGGSSIYYQWGRWLGFPSTCAALTLYDTGDYSGDYSYASQLPLGVDYSNIHIGYSFANHLSGAHGRVWMGSSDWTRERVLNSSIMFGAVDNGYAHGDYIGANEECSWEDRCGNPAPDGYRIPTAEELSIFIPSTGSVSGTYAEVKTINGENYAMQWKVTKKTSNSVAKVEIRSFKTTASTVSKTDSKFNSAPVFTLQAYGYLMNNAEQNGYGTVGFYWSSDTEKLDDGVSNGGIALAVYFNGTSAEFELGSIWRGFGGLVPLIKDENAKSTTLTPWFPLTGV